MKMTVSKYTAGAAEVIAHEVGAGETILAVAGLEDAVNTLEALFMSDDVPDTIYRSVLQGVSKLKSVVSESRDKLEMLELRLQALEKRVTKI